MRGQKKPKDIEAGAELQPPLEDAPLGISREKRHDSFGSWTPKTSLGKMVKKGEVNDIDEILEKGHVILEPEIIDFLIPGIEHTLILVGQSKGKFGGGKRSIWKQTQKKTNEGNKPKFAALAVVGDRNSHIGIGYGKAKETVPAREKAIRKAKLNLIKINKGCGSWACYCKDPHSIPFKVNGRCGSVRITLMPAPKGTNLCTEREVQKMLGLAGLKDIYSKTRGQTRTKINLIYACFEALKKLSTTKTTISHEEIEISS